MPAEDVPSQETALAVLSVQMSQQGEQLKKIDQTLQSFSLAQQKMVEEFARLSISLELTQQKVKSQEQLSGIVAKLKEELVTVSNEIFQVRKEVNELQIQQRASWKRIDELQPVVKRIVEREQESEQRKDAFLDSIAGGLGGILVEGFKYLLVLSLAGSAFYLLPQIVHPPVQQDAND